MALRSVAITTALLAALAGPARADTQDSAEAPAPVEAPVEAPEDGETPAPAPVETPAPAPVEMPAPAAAPASAAPSFQAPPTTFGDVPPPFRMPTRVERFGGTILGVDVAVVGLAAVLGGVPLLAFPFAAPIVHLVHGDPGGAGGSFLLHAGAPVAGALIGYKLEMSDGCDSDMCGFAGLVLGGLAGMITASALDAAFLAYVERPFPSSARPLPAVPTLAFTRDGGLMLGVAGRL